jgi:hypothetical protein
MALQSTGAISLDDIHVEAGGTTGTTVRFNDTDVRALISSTASTQVAMSDFYGASSGPVIGIDDGSLNDFAVASVATASITLAADGTISYVKQTGSFTDTEWATPTSSGIGSSYEARATLVLGFTPQGAAMNTWLALSSPRTWFLNQITNGSKSSTFDIEIRDTATQTIQDTGRISMLVTREP